MKNNKIFNLVFVLSLLGMNILFAQSDYEIVQNFKGRVQQIESSIRNADSLSALNEMEEAIYRLESDFAGNKQLLDQSLYPTNFDRTIEDLRNTYILRRSDFTQIDVLQTEVSGLRMQVDTLNRRNSELAGQFEILESQSKRDSSHIAQLERTIVQLKASLLKRDQVVMNMIDSLLPPSYRNIETLSPKEKQQVISEAEQNNILYHIKRAVNDNIRFLKDTKLYPDDIEDIQNRQRSFSQIWKSVGPTMVEIYSEKGKSTNELKEIDEAFTRWHAQLNQEIWESINDVFAENNIRLRNFSNGEEFTTTLTNYIRDEIKNAEAKGSEAETTYQTFADSAWYDEIEPDWVPFLLDNNMITEKDKDTIDVLIASWKDTVYPGGMNWLYIIIAILVVAVLIFLFTRKKSPPRNSSVEQNS